MCLLLLLKLRMVCRDSGRENYVEQLLTEMDGKLVRSFLATHFVKLGLFIYPW